MTRTRFVITLVVMVTCFTAFGWSAARLYEEYRPRPDPCVQTVPYEAPAVEKRPDLGAFL